MRKMTIIIINNYPDDYSRKSVSEKLGQIELILRKTGKKKIVIWKFSEIDRQQLPDDLEAVILSGSNAHLDEATLKNYETEIEFVKNASPPILGICFGHQLIGMAFGSKLKSLNNYIKNFQTIKIQDSNQIFSSWEKGDSVIVKQHHIDFLSELPENFICLAKSDQCTIEAMKHRTKPIYGIQAHIERATDEKPDGYQIFRNFIIEVVEKNRNSRVQASMGEKTQIIKLLRERKLSSKEIAAKTGVSVGRVASIKAHLTMGTYGNNGENEVTGRDLRVHTQPGKMAVQRKLADKKLTREELGSWLWGAADILRGAVRPEKYGDYILPLLFFKRLSDVYLEEYEKALTKYKSKEVAQQRFLHRFEITEGCLWDDVRSVSTNVGEKLNFVFTEIAKRNSPLDGVINRIDFNNPVELPVDRLVRLVEHFSLKRLGNADVSLDILGDGYEYLLKMFNEEAPQRAGEFYTPRQVVRILAHTHTERTTGNTQRGRTTNGVNGDYQRERAKRRRTANGLSYTGIHLIWMPFNG